MKRRSDLALGAALFAAILIAGVFVLPAFTDSTPAAEAKETSAPEGLRGRGLQVVSASYANTRQIRVIDGDTFEDTAADITYRIENIDTPETGSRARCTAERDLGNRATSTARTLITNAGTFEIRATGRIDRYERAIAFVLIDGHDFGETMIAEGLARPWRGRREPWCDATGNLIP